MSTLLTPFPPDLLRPTESQRASTSTISFSSTSTSSSGTGSSTFDRLSKGSSSSSLTDVTPLASPTSAAKSIFGDHPAKLEDSSSRFSDEQWHGGVTKEQLEVHFANRQNSVPRYQDPWRDDDGYDCDEETDESCDLEPQISALEALAFRLQNEPPTHSIQRALEFMERRKMHAQKVAQESAVSHQEQQDVEDYAQDFELDSRSFLTIPETPDFLTALPSTPCIRPVDHPTTTSGEALSLHELSPLLLDEPTVSSAYSFIPSITLNRSHPTSPVTVSSLLFNRRYRSPSAFFSDRTPTQSLHLQPAAVGLGFPLDNTLQNQDVVTSAGHPASSLLFAGSSSLAVEGFSDYYVENVSDVEPLGAPSATYDTITESSSFELVGLAVANVEPQSGSLATSVCLLDTTNVEHQIDAPLVIHDGEMASTDVESLVEAPLDADASFAVSFATSSSCYSLSSAEVSLPLVSNPAGEYALDADSVFDGPSSDWVNLGFLTGSESTEPLLARLTGAIEDHHCGSSSRYSSRAQDSAIDSSQGLITSLPTYLSLNSIAGSTSYFGDVDEAFESSCDISHVSGFSSCFDPENAEEDMNLDHMNVSLPDDSSFSVLSPIQEEDEVNISGVSADIVPVSHIRRYVPQAPPAHLLNYARNDGLAHPFNDKFNPTVTADSDHIVAINAGILEARRTSSLDARNVRQSLPTITLSSEPDRPMNNGKIAAGLGLGLPSNLVSQTSESEVYTLPTSKACWNLAWLATCPSPARVVSDRSVSISSRSALSPMSNASLNGIKSPVLTTPSSFQSFALSGASMVDAAFLMAAASSQPSAISPRVVSGEKRASKPLPQPPTLTSDSRSKSNSSRSPWNAFTAAMSRISWSSSSSSSTNGASCSGRSPGMIEHTDVPRGLGILGPAAVSSKPQQAQSGTTSETWSRRFKQLF